MFLEQLQEVINSTSKLDILIVIGNFNDKVGSNNKGKENGMCKHGVGKWKWNGENFLQQYQINSLVVIGTIFPHKPRNKISWISPDDKTENQIDHVPISKQHRSSVLDTRAMRGADASGGHELIRSKISIKETVKRRLKYNVTKLQQLQIRKTFSVEFRNRFQVWDEFENVEGICRQDTSKIQSRCMEWRKKEQKPWISRGCWTLVEERKQQITDSKSDRIKEN